MYEYLTSNDLCVCIHTFISTDLISTDLITRACARTRIIYMVWIHTAWVYMLCNNLPQLKRVVTLPEGVFVTLPEGEARWFAQNFCDLAKIFGKRSERSERSRTGPPDIAALPFQHYSPKSQGDFSTPLASRLASVGMTTLFNCGSCNYEVSKRREASYARRVSILRREFTKT